MSQFNKTRVVSNFLAKENDAALGAFVVDAVNEGVISLEELGGLLRDDMELISALAARNDGITTSHLDLNILTVYAFIKHQMKSLVGGHHEPHTDGRDCFVCEIWGKFNDLQEAIRKARG